MGFLCIIIVKAFLGGKNTGGGVEDLSQGQTQPCQKQFIPFMQNEIITFCFPNVALIQHGGEGDVKGWGLKGCVKHSFHCWPMTEEWSATQREDVSWALLRPACYVS